MQPVTEPVKSIMAKRATLAAQSFGSPCHPAVLLVMGATASMLGWPDELCHRLAAREYFVVRYDHRDTGLSTTFAPGSPRYSVEDLAADLIAVMDAFGRPHAHLVGMSLGGLIAQIAALSWPERVASLTLIGSEPLGWDGPPLPHIAPTFLEHFGALGSLDWSDTADVRKFLVRIEELCVGSAYPFDVVRAQARVDAVIERSPSLPSAFNHGAVGLQKDWTGCFRVISQPTLVIHGDEDPILPVQNGEALASGVPGALLRTLGGVGHELPPQVIPELTDWLAEHFASATSGQHAELNSQQGR